MVTGRLFVGLAREPDVLPVGDEVWRNTAVALEALPRGAYVDRLTGERVGVEGDALRVGHVLRHFPVGAARSRALSLLRALNRRAHRSAARAAPCARIRGGPRVGANGAASASL